MKWISVAGGKGGPMRLVRVGDEPTKIGADVRAALTTWGEGQDVLGGVAILGCTPPDSEQAVDAIVVLPRGVLVIVGVDLPDPAMTLEAPLQTPWTVDGWPLVRSEGAVNPGVEALQTASTVASHLQSGGREPLPVAAIVAVGPYVGQVTQPTNDLQRGVRVVSPSTTSILAAARELATYPHQCAAEPAQRLLEALDPDAGKLDTEVLLAEGFPAESDPAAAETMSIPKIDDDSDPATPAIRVTGGHPAPSLPSLVRNSVQYLRSLPRPKLIALSAGVLVVCAMAVLLGQLGGRATTTAPQQQRIDRVDGVEFTGKASQHDASCAQHSFGDVQAWFTRQPCTGLTRQVFTATVTGRPAAVAVAVVDLGDASSAANLRDLLDTAGSGGVNDLLAEGHRMADPPASFDGSAEAVEQDGTQVRIVQTAWAHGGSQPTDVELRALAERGLRLPTG